MKEESPCECALDRHICDFLGCQKLISRVRVTSYIISMDTVYHIVLIFLETMAINNHKFWNAHLDYQC